MAGIHYKIDPLYRENPLFTLPTDTTTAGNTTLPLINYNTIPVIRDSKVYTHSYFTINNRVYRNGQQYIYNTADENPDTGKVDIILEFIVIDEVNTETSWTVGIITNWSSSASENQFRLNIGKYQQDILYQGNVFAVTKPAGTKYYNNITTIKTTHALIKLRTLDKKPLYKIIWWNTDTLAYEGETEWIEVDETLSTASEQLTVTLDANYNGTKYITPTHLLTWNPNTHVLQANQLIDTDGNPGLVFAMSLRGTSAWIDNDTYMAGNPSGSLNSGWPIKCALCVPPQLPNFDNDRLFEGTFVVDTKNPGKAVSIKNTTHIIGYNIVNGIIDEGLEIEVPTLGSWNSAGNYSIGWYNDNIVNWGASAFWTGMLDTNNLTRITALPNIVPYGNLRLVSNESGTVGTYIIDNDNNAIRVMNNQVNTGSVFYNYRFYHSNRPTSSASEIGPSGVIVSYINTEPDSTGAPPNDSNIYHLGDTIIVGGVHTLIKPGYHVEGWALQGTTDIITEYIVTNTDITNAIITFVAVWAEGELPGVTIHYDQGGMILDVSSPVWPADFTAAAGSTVNLDGSIFRAVNNNFKYVLSAGWSIDGGDAIYTYTISFDETRQQIDAVGVWRRANDDWEPIESPTPDDPIDLKGGSRWRMTVGQYQYGIARNSPWDLVNVPWDTYEAFRDDIHEDGTVTEYVDWYTDKIRIKTPYPNAIDLPGEVWEYMTADWLILLNCDEAYNIDWTAEPGNVPYFFFYISGIETKNIGVTKLYLEHVPYYSLGGFEKMQIHLGEDIIEGTVIRETVASDGVFENIIPEPVTLSQPLQFDYWESPRSGANFNFIMSTIDFLNDPVWFARPYTYQDPDGATIIRAIPELPAVQPSSATEIVVENESGTEINTAWGSVQVVNQNLLGEPEPKDLLQAIRSLDMQNGLLAFWQVPVNYVDVTTYQTKLYVLSKLKGLHATYSETISHLLPYAAKNNKVHSLFNIFSLVAKGTGAIATQNAYNLVNTSIEVISDPGPLGSPLFKMSGQRQLSPDMEISYIKGAQWARNTLTLDTPAGSAFYEAQKNIGLSQINIAEALQGGMYQADIARQDNATIQRGISATVQATTLALGAASGLAGGMSPGAASTIAAGLPERSAMANSLDRIAFMGQYNQSMGRPANATGTAGSALGQGSSFSPLSGLINNYFAQADANIQRELTTKIYLNQQLNNDLDRSGLMVRYAMSMSQAAQPLSLPGANDFWTRYTRNTCLLLRFRATNQDLEEIDKFLTKYGYAVNRRMSPGASIQSLRTRTRFNYIMMNDVHCKLFHYGSDVNNSYEQLFNQIYATSLAQQLTNGMRIWHGDETHSQIRYPDFDYSIQNAIRSE